MDFYFHSWRLVPANLLWGIGLGITYVLALVYWPAAVLFTPLLAFPVVGVFRLAGLIHRGASVSFWDGIHAWRELFVPTLVAGYLIVLGAIVLSINLLGGLQNGDLLGWAFATLSAWGLVIGWLWVLCFWPLLADPARRGWGLRRSARAAGLLVVAHPARLAGLGVLLAVFFVLSTVAFAALVAISLAFAALVACHYVLPATDRLEARLATTRIPLAP
ncbi:MAG: hypothetical protein QOH61_279 [Chloroflexota bacterium]|nr:hypothetical protein [Chloroflexota bacterium]